MTPHPSIVKAQLVGHTGPREVLVHLYGRCSNPVHDVSGTLPYRNTTLRGSSTAMRLQWIISTSTGPRRRLPRGPCIVYPSAYYHDLSPDSVVAINPKKVDRLWKSEKCKYLSGWTTGTELRESCTSANFPAAGRGVGDEIFYRFCIGFCIDFLLISSIFNRFSLPRAVEARAPQTWWSTNAFWSTSTSCDSCRNLVKHQRILGTP